MESWNGWTLEKYLNYCANIPRFLRDNGYLCVADFKDGKYHCGTDNLRGQDTFLESELTLYVEPKPEVKSEPKQYPKSLKGEWVGFKVGDRVRVIQDDVLYGTDAKGKTGTISGVANPSHPVIKFDTVLKFKNSDNSAGWG